MYSRLRGNCRKDNVAIKYAQRKLTNRVGSKAAHPGYFKMQRATCNLDVQRLFIIVIERRIALF